MSDTHDRAGTRPRPALGRSSGPSSSSSTTSIYHSRMPRRRMGVPLGHREVSPQPEQPARSDRPSKPTSREPARVRGADRMMNDRFSAQLRQHLLATADERPAGDTLAAIVDGVATTAQYHQLTARADVGPQADGRVPLCCGAIHPDRRGAGDRHGGGRFVRGWQRGAAHGVRRDVEVDRPRGREYTDPGRWRWDEPSRAFCRRLRDRSPACRADAVKVFTMDGTVTIVDDRLDTCGPMAADAAS